MKLICKHPGCGNECPPERMSTRGYKIQYKQCHACSCSISSYGINNGQKKELLEKQKHKCKICQQKIELLGQTRKDITNRTGANVDHCHETGKIRGLLCTSCNRALGLFKDDPTILTNAINYLK